MIDPRDPPAVLVHFYRASVQHADVWRQRLDATTNWAVVTTAAVITFAFGNRRSPHFVVLLAFIFDFLFLYMESRRYQAYRVWQRRIVNLHRYMIAPALRARGAEDPALSTDELREGWVRMGANLGRSVPDLPLWAALGYRVRRNYGPLVTLVLLTWLLKLYIHPSVAGSWIDFVDRAAIGLMPGAVVLALVALLMAAFVTLATAAPTERMRDWSELPPPIERLLPTGGGRGGEGPEEER